MKFSTKHRTCKTTRRSLESLLREELSAEETVAIDAHLTKCTSCQIQLTELAGGSDWWLDASRWLEGPADQELDQFAAEDEVADNDQDRFARLLDDLRRSQLLLPSENDDDVGRVGRYSILRVLGAGGTGVVLLGRDSELARTVAIKVLNPLLATNGPARSRFAREARAAAAVVDENVVAVHQVESEGVIPYIVMQYIDGDSLQQLVMREGPLEAKAALRITAQIASALAAAHAQGIVHRDVKPANILTGGSALRAWITDFGLARAVDDASLTRTGFIAGTPHYMSPEQARGETIGIASDLFGLGSVLYFMLTGRPPFRAERTLAVLNRICQDPHRPIAEINPDVPQAVSQLVDQLLIKDANARLADPESLQQACHKMLAANSLDSLRTDASEQLQQDAAGRSTNPRRRWRSRTPLFGLLTLAIAMVSAGVALRFQIPIGRKYKDPIDSLVYQLPIQRDAPTRVPQRFPTPLRAARGRPAAELPSGTFPQPLRSALPLPFAAAGALPSGLASARQPVAMAAAPLNNNTISPREQSYRREQAAWDKSTSAFENELKQLRQVTPSPQPPVNLNDPFLRSLNQLEQAMKDF